MRQKKFQGTSTGLPSLAGPAQPLQFMAGHGMGQIGTAQVQHLAHAPLPVHDHGRHHEVQRRSGPVRAGQAVAKGGVVRGKDKVASQLRQHLLHDAALYGAIGHARQAQRFAVEQVRRADAADAETARKGPFEPATLPLPGLPFQQQDAQRMRAFPDGAKLVHPVRQDIQQRERIVENDQRGRLPAPVREVGLAQ